MKKFLLILFLFFFSLNVCIASSKEDRKALDNYGVNKNIKVTDNNLDDILDTKVADASLKVYDYADILTDDEETKLKKEALDFYKETGFDIVILTDSFYNYDDEDNYEYAQNFYDYNDFGINFEHYSGVLFLRDANSSSPFFNIYAFGDAQLYYSSERMESILDNIQMNFSGYSSTGGYHTFIDEITKYYEMGIPKEMKHYYIDEKGMLVKEYVPPILLAIGIATVVTIIVVSILVGKNKMIKRETKALNYLDINSVNFTVKQDKFIRDSISSYTISSSSGGSGGRSSSIGSSGRGFSGGSGRRG